METYGYENFFLYKKIDKKKDSYYFFLSVTNSKE